MDRTKWNKTFIILFALVILLAVGFEAFGQVTYWLGYAYFPTLSEILVTLIPLNILIFATAVVGISAPIWLVWHWIVLHKQIFRDKRCSGK